MAQAPVVKKIVAAEPGLLSWGRPPPDFGRRRRFAIRKLLAAVAVLLLCAASADAARKKTAAPEGPRKANAALETARGAFAAGRFKAMTPLLNQALKAASKKPANVKEQAEIQGMWGVVHLASGKKGPAAKAFAKAVRLDASYELPSSAGADALAMFGAARDKILGTAARRPSPAAPPTPAVAPPVPPGPVTAAAATGPVPTAPPGPPPVTSSAAPVAAAPAAAAAPVVTASLATAAPQPSAVPQYSALPLDVTTIIVAPPPMVIETKPFYQRGWFLTLVTVAVAGGAGVGTWAFAKSSQRTTLPQTSLGELAIP